MKNILAIKKEVEKHRLKRKARALEWREVKRKAIQDDKFAIKNLIDSGFELDEAMNLVQVYSDEEKKMFNCLAIQHLKRKKKQREKLLFSLTHNLN
jgi:hypothetical protein